eukprot:EG_transcript_20681
MFHVLQSLPNNVQCPFPTTSSKSSGLQGVRHKKCWIQGLRAFECSQIFDPFYYIEQLFGSVHCTLSELVEFCTPMMNNHGQNGPHCNRSLPCAPYLCGRFNFTTLFSVCNATMNPKAHYLDVGVKRGVAMHPGRDVVKVVLMHKDHWPMLRLWVLYHAHIFGLKNLIVLDESTQREPLKFLQKMQRLGLTVLKTSGGLNTINVVMDALFDLLRWSADYFLKLDTDEFVVKFGKGISVEPSEVFRAIRVAKLRGHRSRFFTSFIYQSTDVDLCWPLGERFVVGNHTPKAFMPAPTFLRSDLGFHFGEAM